MIAQPADAVSFSELLGYAEEEWRRWRAWLEAHREALDVPIDIAGAKQARDLVKHIVLVDARYGEWLLGEPLTAPDALDGLSADDLFSAGDRAYRLFHRLLDTTSAAQWAEALAFPKPLEHLHPTRRKCFIHVLVHSTRHWAQLATALRAAGQPTDWQHDLVLSPAIV
jgi:uncharacterized damage-inducible protein DinB